MWCSLEMSQSAVVMAYLHFLQSPDYYYNERSGLTVELCSYFDGIARVMLHAYSS